jgi:hypothetical protein
MSALLQRRRQIDGIALSPAPSWISVQNDKCDLQQA